MRTLKVYYITPFERYRQYTKIECLQLIEIGAGRNSIFEDGS